MRYDDFYLAQDDLGYMLFGGEYKKYITFLQSHEIYKFNDNNSSSMDIKLDDGCILRAIMMGKDSKVWLMVIKNSVIDGVYTHVRLIDEYHDDLGALCDSMDKQIELHGGARGGVKTMWLTKRQIEIYDYIKNFILENQYPPSVREIAEGVGLKSSSTVHSHLTTLKEKGYITWKQDNPRTIVIK